MAETPLQTDMPKYAYRSSSDHDRIKCSVSVIHPARAFMIIRMMFSHEAVSYAFAAYCGRKTQI